MRFRTLARKDVFRPGCCEGDINPTPIDTTIDALTRLPAPATLPQEHRIAPTEFQRYKIHAVLVEYKREADDDFHLVIADLMDRNKTMVVEIAAPNCADGGAEKRLEPARCEFLSQFADPGRSWSGSNPFQMRSGSREHD